MRNFLHAQPPEQIRTKAIDIQVTLTPEDAATGGIVMIEAPGYYPCALCRGTGQEGGFPCLACDELGVVEEKEMIPVAIPSMLGSYQQIEIPLRGLGIHNFYLRLHFNVAPQ
jgi:molecular chaperone DnaJ